MAGTLIVNEFLTFVQNKIDVLDELSIVQICASNYSDADIEDGKNTLCNSCPLDGIRNVQRKGEDKRKKNIKDVIKIFKEVDPTSQPTFVAKDLNRLPPVSFDHVDVSRLLKDISNLKTEIQAIRYDCMTKSEMIQLETRISCQITNLQKKDTNLHIGDGVEKKRKTQSTYDLNHTTNSQVPEAQQKIVNNKAISNDRGRVNSGKPLSMPNATNDSVFLPRYRDILLSPQSPVQMKTGTGAMSNRDENESMIQFRSDSPFCYRLACFLPFSDFLGS